jgi:triosephosphate isomerase (TIM)
MTNQRYWIIANWKSNKTLAEDLEWLSKVGPELRKSDQVKVVVCPMFDALPEMKKHIQVGNFPIILGSQDLSPFDTGAYTGEEPAAILKDYVGLSILGHSERRQNFKENDELVAQKVEQAKKYQITPVLCVQGADTPVPEGCQVIAYEPVFAIGTGNPDTPQNANEVAGKLKERNGAELDVLYGGSVNHENCKAFLQQDNISGLLIGKSSLDAEEFVKIVQQAYLL